MEKPTLEHALDVFLKSKCGLAPKTKEYYAYLGSVLLRLARKTGLGNRLVHQIGIDHLSDLLITLDEDFPGMGETTKNKVFKLIKSFFAWMQRTGWLQINLSQSLAFRRVQSTPTKPLSDEEIKSVLFQFPRNDSEFCDLCMVTIFLEAGPRCAELCDLRLSDWTGDRLSIRNGKGGSNRQISIGQHARQLLQKYVQEIRPNKECAFLFQSSAGARLKPINVMRRIRRWGQRAGVPNLAPHRFRATFATQFVLREGGDLLKLSALLGHSTLDMSRRYVKLRIKEEALITNSSHSLVDGMQPEKVQQQMALLGKCEVEQERAEAPTGQMLISRIQTLQEELTQLQAMYFNTLPLQTQKALRQVIDIGELPFISRNGTPHVGSYSSYTSLTMDGNTPNR
jgi:site-specific recombinase XerD